MRILILGGYGVFGGRLATLLGDLSQVTLLIAGRTKTKAQTFCDAYGGTTTALPVALDRADIAHGLAQWKPDVVVDASGPFQDYGDAKYDVIRACIASSVHYLDFADAADFVFGVDQFDDAAKRAEVFVLSGVSSFPVLTAAVLREMAAQMQVHDVQGGIAPSPYAGIGLNVMKAVVGYAGGPVKLLRDGNQITAYGLTESMRYTISPPGALPLRNIHFSLVDVPDLQVIPPHHPDLNSIWMGAGPVPEVLHLVLNILAKLRARFGLPTLTPFSKLFYAVLNMMRFGEHRGGMFVHATGTKDGAPHHMSWHLLAERDDGPLIPSMAIEVILRKAVDGVLPVTGARAAAKALSLADYNYAFEGREIQTGWRSAADEDTVYRTILGRAYDRLPDQLQKLHDVRGTQDWNGTASVMAGRNWAAKLIAKIFGFPTTMASLPVSVTFSKQDGVELWERDFDGSKFSSTQSVGTGRNANLLQESFGPFDFGLALVIKDDKLFLIPRRWSIWGLPLPRWALPSGASYETQIDGRFHFDVTISAPIIGLVAHYQGNLERAI